MVASHMVPSRRTGERIGLHAMTVVFVRGSTTGQAAMSNDVPLAEASS